MKNILLLLCFSFSLSASKSFSQKAGAGFTSFTVDTIFKGDISIRAIAISNDTLFYGGTERRIGYISANAQFQTTISRLPQTSDFRSIALTSNNVFFLNAGNPAKLFKFPKKFGSYDVVYEENGDKVFYDSMAFWDDQNGIAVGDPTQDCLSILVTHDGGYSWKKIPCESLPKIVEGEAAFAASNSNICLRGNHVWIVSGGMQSRIFHSPDRGQTWNFYNTPIVQGQAMTGIFTADFYDEKIGVIAGGNYETPHQNSQNKAITSNGGKTWKLLAEGKDFGYTSCIQFVPKSNGKELVAVGLSGLHYSKDGGNSWKQLLSDKTLYTIRFQDENTAFAAGKDKIIRIEFKK